MLAQQAQLERAYLLWKTDEQAQALATIERFLKLHPTSPAYDYALYLQGLINFNDNLGFFGSLAAQDLSERDQQASRDAYQSFRQLTERFPQSSYAEDARLRMNYIVNSLAAYEVHVARYYFRRGAYVAAANRAQQAVLEFQQSPAAEEALYIMVAELRPPRPDPAARRRRPGAAVELPEHADPRQRPGQQADALVEALVSRRAQALSGTAASTFSHSIASLSRSRRAIGGRAANSRRP